VPPAIHTDEEIGTVFAFVLFFPPLTAHPYVVEEGNRAGRPCSHQSDPKRAQAYPTLAVFSSSRPARNMHTGHSVIPRVGLCALPLRRRGTADTRLYALSYGTVLENYVIGFLMLSFGL
jgi:hypothetical protein